MSAVTDVWSDESFEPAQAKDEKGVGSAWRRDIIRDMERGVGVMVWKADPGIYKSIAPPYSETFVVLAGTAEIAIGDGPSEPIAPGSIVHMPLGFGMRLEVKTPYRMVATVVLGKT